MNRPPENVGNEAESRMGPTDLRWGESVNGQRGD